MKKIPNILSISRIILALPLIFLPLPSVWFYIVYALCGITDIFDGYLARKLCCVSRIGSLLDSAGDIVLFVCLILRFLLVIDWRLWIVICIGGIGLLRLVTFLIGLIRFHRPIMLHTFANKVAGSVVFASPVLYVIFKADVIVIVATVIAVIASVEEAALLLTQKEPDLDQKGWFFK